ncbi:MAG TPA: LysM peptidoglycan-binding domain-containing M23 family metallopeptidase [Anaerolineaceae bacterium]|nr:LysM peptidoglycan-binding domain-containing M23 family metallopeptidase [Anaerolineaceae bacterium]
MNRLLRAALALTLSLTFALSAAPARTARAQYNGAYYTTQEGDTLTEVAFYFRVSLNDLIALNPMPDPDNLPPGKVLLIPGFEDLQGELLRADVPAGESMRSLKRAYRMPDELFQRLNFVTAPDAFMAGQQYTYLAPEGLEQTRLQLVEGVTPLELAVYGAASPWLPAVYNGLPAPWRLLRNDTLFLPGAERGAVTALLPLVTGVTLDQLAQGKTSVLTASASQGTALSGELLGYPLRFFADSSGGYTALQGVPRLADPGVTSITMQAAAPDGRVFTIEQHAYLQPKNYGFDPELEVLDSVIDPAITGPELEFVTGLVADAPPEKLWQGRFEHPSTTPEFITSWYGRLRSFNGSGYTYFHSGLDYGGGASSPILAPAPGVVVYTGTLDVRGNTTLISHGWGVYTGYWHQSRIDVQVGDTVQTGQTIGMMGETGRVTGPHLHFSVFVGGVEVDPEDWINGLYVYTGG